MVEQDRMQAQEENKDLTANQGELLDAGSPTVELAPAAESGQEQAPPKKEAPQAKQQGEPRVSNRVHVAVEDKAEMSAEISARVLELLGLQVGELNAVVKDEQVQVTVSKVTVPEGKRLEGRTWESLQFLLNKAVNRSALKRTRVQVQAEGQRSRRGGGLNRVVQAVARKVQHTGKAMAIGPLNPQDLRLFNQQFGRTSGVSVRTVGEDDKQKLLIAPSTGGGGRRRRRR